MTTTKYDLIIIGGGIYGIMLAMEAKKRNLYPLLLDKGRFGNETTKNSSQIIHGGLRYLQSLDIKRHGESVKERSWFFNTFPDYIKPLPCLFPLYNRGLYRTSLFRLAFFLDAFLKSSSGKILDKKETIKIFPQVDRSHLKGAALWVDGTIVNQEEFISKLLRMGGDALEFQEVKSLILVEKEVHGVKTKKDSFHSDVVINATGPNCRALATEMDKDIPQLFYPSLAFNLLFDRPPLSTHAIALRTPASTYFLRPLDNKLFAGTYHLPWENGKQTVKPPEKHIEQFIAHINAIIPGIQLKKEEVKDIRSGLLPAKQAGTASLATKEVIIDHGMSGGPKGFYSISGVKWTMARKVAEKTLDHIFR